MARRKPKPTFTIETREQADEVLAEIAARNRAVDHIEADLNERIDALKQEARDAAKDDQERIAELEAALSAYAAYHKSRLFADRRSLELNHGVLGYRKSNEVKPQPKHTWDMVLGRLKELELRDGIRTKEVVNKDALREWPTERLELVGARRVPKDTFYYETKEEELAE